jgi:hypothetical protein
MSYIRIQNSEVITYSAVSLVAEAGATNAAAVVSIVVPGISPVLHIDAIIAGYQGGAASQTFTVAGIAVGDTASSNRTTTITNTPAPVTMNIPEYAVGQTVTFTLPAGGVGVIGYVSVLYRID